MTKTTAKPRFKTLFPAINKGGYVIAIRFLDEHRGERFFDTRWSVHLPAARQINEFGLYSTVNFRYENNHDDKAADRLRGVLKIGDQVSISVEKLTSRGRSFPKTGRMIKVTNLREVSGVLMIAYE